MRQATFVMTAAALALAATACSRTESGGSDNAASETQAEAGDLSSLNGVWQADLASVKFEGKPDEFLLQNGRWTCGSCIPPLTVAADGQFHAVADRPYYDSISVKAVDDRTVETRRRKGEREVSSNVMQLSADGNMITNKFRNATTPGNEFEGTTTLRRTGPAPAGAHPISGQWMPEKVGDYTEEALRLSLQVEGNKVTSTIQGQTYAAELGGPAVAVQNDPGKTMVAISREGAGIKETYTRDGKEVGIVTIMPNADGQSVTITNTDPRDGTKTSWTATKAG